MPPKLKLIPAGREEKKKTSHRLVNLNKTMQLVGDCTGLCLVCLFVSE